MTARLDSTFNITRNVLACIGVWALSRFIILHTPLLWLMVLAVLVVGLGLVLNNKESK